MDIEEAVKLVNEVDPKDTRTPFPEVIVVFMDYLEERVKEMAGEEAVVNDLGLAMDELDVPIWFAFTLGHYFGWIWGKV